MRWCMMSRSFDGIGDRANVTDLEPARGPPAVGTPVSS